MGLLNGGRIMSILYPPYTKYWQVAAHPPIDKPFDPETTIEIITFIRQRPPNIYECQKCKDLIPTEGEWNLQNHVWEKHR